MSIFEAFAKLKEKCSKGRKGKEKPVSEKFFETVRALGKNEILVIPSPTEKVSSPFESKLGGKPYLPRDFVWPTYTDKESGATRHLSFFAQINLSDVRPYDKDGVLPERGTLYFFYECESMRWGFDPDDNGAARVIYLDTSDVLGLEPRDIPSDIAEAYVIPEIAISFEARRSYPSFEELEMHTDLKISRDEYDKALERLGIDTDDFYEGHKLLGYANVIQDEMLTEAERVSRGIDCGGRPYYESVSEQIRADVRRHATDWLLLCQISTVSKGDFEYTFGDCGMLYFYVKRTDLAAWNFENAHFSVQCG